MRAIAAQSRLLTSYLETLLDDFSRKELWTMLTPRDPEQRGAMLSLRWHDSAALERTVEGLREACVVVDVRRPDVMRVTPSPLYNTFEDVWRFVEELGSAIQDCVPSNVV